LFGGRRFMDGVNSPEFGFQFLPMAADARAYSAPITPALLHAGEVHAMKLDLKPFDFAQAVARAGLKPDGTPLTRGVAASAGASFQNAMTQALGSVSQTQNQAEVLQRELQMDNPSVSLEQTMVAMQKAQIGFQGVLAVRNRLVQAYSDIMNMQV
jgi:flagellar hook-basal body complex protein FliE